MSEKNEWLPWLRLAIEAGPLVLFVVALGRSDIFWATGVFMAATVVSLAASYALERRLPTMPLVGGAFVLIFGAISIYLQDETFIKLKPTVVNALFAGALLFGLATGRPLMKVLLGASLQMTDEGWRRLSLNWALFFLAMAATNEFVWRTQTTAFWANFKLYGFLPLTFVFALSQVPLMRRFEQRTAVELPPQRP